MDASVKFYSDVLGLKVKSKEHYPSIVELDSGTELPLILNLVEQKASVDYPRQSQSLFNFQSENLKDEMQRLKQKGVEFIHDEPRDCPVGIFAAFRDPSGNVHELIEFTN